MELSSSTKGNEKENDTSIELIATGLKQFEHAICQLRAETLDLERKRNKYQIHLQSFKNDYESLKIIYKNFKQRLDSLGTRYVDPYPQQQVVELEKHQPPPPPPPPAPVPVPKPIPAPKVDETPPNVSPTSLSHQEIDWSITLHDPKYNSNGIALKYALNTCSVLCCVKFDSTGERFAFADGRTVFVINTSDGSLVSSFSIPYTLAQTEIHTRSLAISPDNELLAISGPNNTIVVFGMLNHRHLTTLEEHTDIVSALLFVPGTNKLISGGFDGRICIWDTKNFNLVNKILHGPADESPRSKEDMVISLTASYDSSFIVVGFMGGSVGMYENTFSQPINTFNAHAEYLLDVKSAHKSLLLATSSHDKTLKLWSLKGIASCRKTLTGHTNCVLSSCFSNEDDILFSGSKDETINAWDPKSGELLFTINGHKNTIFKIDHHPNQRCFVSCSGDGLVCVWDY